jgi:hypothetical protein
VFGFEAGAIYFAARSCGLVMIDDSFYPADRFLLDTGKFNSASKRMRYLKNIVNGYWQAEQAAFTLVPFSAYSSTLKMEAIFSYETSGDFQRATRHYIPEDSILSCFSTHKRV